MKEKAWHKFPVLFSLYIAQSIPMSFFSTVVPVIMRQEHYSLQSIGLLQLVKLPWIFKFLWAPVVDNRTRNSKQLRQWIVASELFYAAVILSMGFFSLQADFKLIVILMVIAFIASATQDIATDAYAILLLRRHERSLGNSMQSAGSFVGTLFGTGILLIAYHYFGWVALVVLLAAFVAFALLPLGLYRKGQLIEKQYQHKVSLSDIWRFFGQKGYGKLVLILAFYYIGFIGILTLLKPYLVDLGYNVKQIGFISGIVGTACASLCAFGAGFIVRRIGLNTSLFVFAGVALVAAVYFYFLSMGVPAKWEIYLGVMLVWGAYGLGSVAIYTLAMEKVRAGREGTDFTVQIVITQLASLIISVLSGKLADKIGYTGFFGIEVILCILTFFVLLYAIPRKKKNENKSAIA